MILPVSPCHVWQLDFKRMQKMLRALYVLMDMSHGIVPVAQPEGILPIAGADIASGRTQSLHAYSICGQPRIRLSLPSSRAGADNVDKSVWKFVLNFLQKDEINVGLARLYCDAVGWDLGAMCGDERDPRTFLRQELARLKDRFHRLTGQHFDQLVDEDVSNQAQLQRAADIRKQVGHRSLGIKASR